MRDFNTPPRDIKPGYLSDRELTDERRVADFLASNGVDVNEVLEIPSDDRPAYLIERLLNTSDIERFAERPVYREGAPSDEVGLIVVKPEMLPHIDKIQDYMTRIGTEYRTLPTAFISKEEWLSIYGYKIRKAPDIINLYVTQRALGMTPIIFRHLPVDFYADYAEQLGITPPTEMVDISSVFDGIFCGSSDTESEGTLRWDVVRKSLEDSGFDSMDGDSKAFDMYNFYKEGHMSYVYKVFNGVHIPSNNSECQYNLDVFLK